MYAIDSSPPVAFARGKQVDMAAFHEDHPEYSRGLLTFALEFLLANKWPSNTLMGDYNDCDESCVVGQTERCGCTCKVDPFEFTDDEVRDTHSSR